MVVERILTLCTLFILLNYAYSVPSSLYHRPFVARNSKNSLRKEDLKVDLSTYVKVYGYFETVTYTVNYGNGTCSNAVGKLLSVLNTCAPSAYHYGEYYRATVIAYPEGHTYYWYDQFFSDSSCCNPISDYVMEFADWILICENNTMEHVISEPLNPLTDNLGGFALLLYDTQSNCTNNDYTEGVLESMYGRLNYCFQGDYGDEIYVSCSSTALVKQSFPSHDGTCSGAPVETIFSPNNICTSGNTTLSEMYAGWTNYQCEIPLLS